MLIRSKGRGFTLIELLVVVSIISLLSSVVLASLRQSREKALIAKGLIFERSILGARGDGLHFEMLFEDNLVDNSSNSPVSIVTGSVGYSSDTPTGRGKSLSLTGGQRLQATVDVSETSYAVSFWFKTVSASSNLLYVWDTSTGGYDRSIWLQGGNVQTYVYSSETLTSTGKDYADGKWHHLLHTYGGLTGGQEVYVDGQLILKGTRNFSHFDWQTQIRFADGYVGLLDNLRIYRTSFAGD